ncbi:hypothetical protein RRF57_011717 [Xylaria bambusicola]|uniref:Uncharacterized protein n=1 Tax=Xylaria bambusicola TaxID=326684 RepID=A0AAN7Z3Y3_9PEZI
MALKAAQVLDSKKFQTTYGTLVNVFQSSNAHVGSIKANLSFEQFYSTRDSFGTPDISKHERAPNTNSAHTKCEQLNNICTISNTTVRINFGFLEDARILLINLNGYLEGCTGPINLPTPVVREVYRTRSVLNSQPGVLNRLDALQHYRDIELPLCLNQHLCYDTVAYGTRAWTYSDQGIRFVPSTGS